VMGSGRKGFLNPGKIYEKLFGQIRRKRSLFHYSDKYLMSCKFFML
jgi:hypothetical protein